MKSFTEAADELQKVLELSRQSWLLGAGVSFKSNVPPIHPLTQHVSSTLSGTSKDIFDGIKSELPDKSHVEDVLSHLGDLIAIAGRSKAKVANIAGHTRSVDQLTELYKSVLSTIGKTVRYGFKEVAAPGASEIGTIEKPIVTIKEHLDFIQVLFASRANLEERSVITFFSTNYDTLLEDALALSKRVAIDGFSGGAMAFWDGSKLDPNLPLQTAWLRRLVSRSATRAN
jgi:hypothetical protein